MSNIIYTVPFDANFIKCLVDFVYGQNKSNQLDFSNIGIIFPGKRPSHYFIKLLSEKLNTVFFPPAIFSITEFIEYLSKKYKPALKPISKIDSIWILFNIVKNYGIFSDSFEHFYLWGFKFLSLLEELSTELIDINSIEKYIKTGIEFETPDKEIRFLENITLIYKEFYNELEKNNFTTMGLNSFVALNGIQKDELLEFDKLYFSGFFALKNAEKNILKSLIKKKKVEIIWQLDDEKNWTILKELKEELNAELKELVLTKKNEPEIKIYFGVDTHSELRAINIIFDETLTNPDKTLVVLPDPDALIPFLSQVMSKRNFYYNISMGYPFKRTPIFALLSSIIRCHETKRNNEYWTKDYLCLILHPYIKSIPNVREIVNKIEAKLVEENKLFISLSEIESFLDEEERNIISEIHDKFITRIENIDRIKELSEYFIDIVETLVKKSNILDYPFAGEFLNKFLEALEELQKSILKNEILDKSSLFELFIYYISSLTVPFEGTPLKGLQVLGMLETRNLNFDKVIIIDMNEGIIPESVKYDSLLPIQIRKTLTLPDYRKSDEIYKYHFTRLIKGAKEVYLIYKKNKHLMRSRFIEQIIWEKEIKANKLGELEPIPVFFNIETKPEDRIKKVKKTAFIAEKLKEIEFSATSLDSYINCPLSFYYRYILQLKEKEEIQEEIDAKEIGELIHQILAEFYFGFVNKKLELTKKDKERFNAIIDKNFWMKYKEKKGRYILLYEIIKHRLNQFFEKEKKEKIGVEILGVEKEYMEAPIKLDDSLSVILKGKIDRIEKRDNVIYIVDYKTGEIEIPDIKSMISVITTRKEIKKKIKSFQLPIYLFLYKTINKIESWENLNCSLYSIKEAKEKLLFENINNEQKKYIMDEILIPSLKSLILEILNKNIDFEKDSDSESRCYYCPYAIMC